MDVKYRRPFDGDYPISFSFGQSPDWYLKQAGYPHNGVDYPLPDGTPIYACDRGTVIEVGNTPSGWGQYVRVEHEWGMSHYAHLSEINVKQAQVVGTWHKIGLSGHSGWATGPHLHFGVKLNGHQDNEMHNWADPAPRFVPVEVVSGQSPQLYTEETVVRCPICNACFAIKKGV